MRARSTSGLQYQHQGQWRSLSNLLAFRSLLLGSRRDPRSHRASTHFYHRKVRTLWPREGRCLADPPPSASDCHKWGHSIDLWTLSRDLFPTHGMLFSPQTWQSKCVMWPHDVASDVASCSNVLKQDVYEPDLREEMSHRLSSKCRWCQQGSKCSPPNTGRWPECRGRPGSRLRPHHKGGHIPNSPVPFLPRFVLPVFFLRMHGCSRPWSLIPSSSEYLLINYGSAETGGKVNYNMNASLHLRHPLLLKGKYRGFQWFHDGRKGEAYVHETEWADKIQSVDDGEGGRDTGGHDVPSGKSPLRGSLSGSLL